MISINWSVLWWTVKLLSYLVHRVIHQVDLNFFIFIFLGGWNCWWFDYWSVQWTFSLLMWRSLITIRSVWVCVATETSWEMKLPSSVITHVHLLFSVNNKQNSLNEVVGAHQILSSLNMRSSSVKPSCNKAVNLVWDQLWCVLCCRLWSDELMETSDV